MSKILVSACLLGIECRYKGDGCPCQKVIELAKDHTLIPVCPEQLGGRPTPRIPVEIKNGRVVEENGCDRTEEFVKGAEETLRIAKMYGCKKAILKAKSPSCGFGKIYDGSFSRTLTEGNGIAAQMLADNGIEIVNENEIKRCIL